MSKDVKHFTACDHFVSGKQYRSDMCPRCYGKDYYMDIWFGPDGEAVLTDNTIKLQQECLKVLLDDKISDPFFPFWGSEIGLFVGKKKTDITKARLEMAIRRAIERLKQIQEQESLTNANITGEEILNQIEYMELEPLSVTDWRCKIVISNVAGEIMTQEITL